MKTLVYSTHGFDRPFIEKAANGKHELNFTTSPLNKNTTNLAKGFEAIALFSSDKASKKVIEKLYEYGIRFIALRSVGYDHVDLKAAKDVGIKVANVPAYSPNAIAEHAVALLLALNRKLLLGQHLMEQNNFQLDKLVGFDLYGKTIGVIGTGKIGAAFAKIMNGFGCKLVACDIELNQELMKKTDIEYTSLVNVCKRADVISVCCPLDDQTKYMFDKETFSSMKKGAIFINTARGGIVNTIDLMHALDSGIVSAAGLDVYENEKAIFFKDHKNGKINDKIFEKLRSYENVLITGHQAFLTNEALERIADTTIENLNSWEQSGVSKNEL